MFDKHPFQEVREEKLVFMGFETKNYGVSAIVYNTYWFMERIAMAIIILKLQDKPMI